MAIVACQPNPKVPTITRIAFGSCAHEDKPQPMLDVAVGLSPEIFIYLGDNIYGDTKEMDTLKAKYAKLAAKPSFQNLAKQANLLAIWDDHDYGANDAGRYYPFKEASKEIFMDFWKVPADSDRRKHKGIYGVEYVKKDQHTVQIILLDTRTFRDNLLLCPKGSDSTFCKNDYQINNSSDSAFLGETQWKWLEEQLKAKADVRIIASSNQFSHEYNGWESWTNVPQEQKRMVNLIHSTKANGVIFISGDVHWGEISKMKTKNGYPIYDVTSSGITQTWDDVEPNKNRIGEVIRQNNIGYIEISTLKNKTEIILSIYDITKKAVVEHKVDLDEISF
jgi:alkaline phosphatase D